MLSKILFLTSLTADFQKFCHLKFTMYTAISIIVLNDDLSVIPGTFLLYKTVLQVKQQFSTVSSLTLIECYAGQPA